MILGYTVFSSGCSSVNDKLALAPGLSHKGQPFFIRLVRNAGYLLTQPTALQSRALALLGLPLTL